MVSCEVSLMAIVNLVISKKRKRQLYRKMFREVYPDLSGRMTVKQLDCFVWHRIANDDLHFNGYVNPSIPDTIFLCLPNIQRLSIRASKSLGFLRTLCQTISHEEMHKWLETNVDVETSVQYDRIYKKIREHGIMA
jgi:hypothetical protein